MQQVSERLSPVSIGVIVLITLMAGGVAVGVGFGSTNTVGALAFLSVALWFVVAWRFGIAALIVISCIDGFIKIVHASTATYMLKDITLGLTLIGMLAALAVRQDLRPHGSWRGVWVWGCFIAFLAVQIVNPSTSLSAAIAGFRAHALFALLYVVGVVYFDGPKRFINAANLVIAGITFAAFIGIVQYFMGDAWLQIAGGLQTASRHYVTFNPLASVIPGATAVIYRSYGTLVDPEALGLACSFGIIYASAALARSRGMVTVMLSGAIVIMMIAMMFAGARSAMLGAAVGSLALMVIAFTNPSMRRVAWLMAALFVLALPLSMKLSGGTVQDRLSPDATGYAANTRTHSANIVLNSVVTKPLGIGLGATGAGGKFRAQGTGGKNSSLAVDNLYLAYLYETGPLGLILLVAVQGSFLTLTFRAMRSARRVETQATYAGMAAAQVGLLTASFLTQGAFDYAPVSQAFWLFSGAIAIPKRVEGEA